MSQLISIRQRLKAVATIKKITSAMRLIARSSLTQLQNKVNNIHEFHHEIKELLSLLLPYAPKVHSPFLPNEHLEERILYICVGAQKGLCGNFNSQLNYWFYKNQLLLTNPSIRFMAVGKSTSEFVKSKGYQVDHTFGFLSPQSLVAVTHEIVHYITSAKIPYTKVVLVGNRSKNFFSHELVEHLIVPLVTQQNEEVCYTESFTFEQSHEMILEKLLETYSYNIIYINLLAALIAEQNARFIAMDNATRNANQFLDALKRQYNKMRQAKITKELTELSAHFQK